MSASAPLSGLHVVAVEQYGAGPFGTQWLADLGAQVVKIEQPREGGDVSRGVGPYFSDDLPRDRASLFFQSFNRNKKSLCVDLTSPEGKEVLHDLVRNADGLVNNLRGDVPARLGLTYEAVAPVNPRIVCAHLSGYGRDGSRAAWPGYDYLMQAEAGYFALTGEPDGPPARMGLSVVDMMGGSAMALGLLAGVIDARRTGTGRDVDVALFDVAMFHLSYVGTWRLAAGVNTARVTRSAHPSLTPCQTYRTADGWIYLMCNKEKFWRRLCEAIGRSQWAADPRFVDFPARLAHREALTGLLDDALSARTTAEWMATFGGSVPAAPILDVAGALDNPFVGERGLVRVASDGEARVPMPASPIRTSGAPSCDRAAPGLGEHTHSLLSELGYREDRIRSLLEAGVVR